MHFKIFKMITTRGFLTGVECTKSIFGRGSARTPLGELMTLPRPPSQLGRGTPPPHSSPPRRVRRLGLVSSPAATRPRRLRRLVPKNSLRNFFLDTALSSLLPIPSFFSPPVLCRETASEYRLWLCRGSAVSCRKRILVYF